MSYFKTSNGTFKFKMKTLSSCTHRDHPWGEGAQPIFPRWDYRRIGGMGAAPAKTLNFFGISFFFLPFPLLFFLLVSPQFFFSFPPFFFYFTPFFFSFPPFFFSSFSPSFSVPFHFFPFFSSFPPPSLSPEWRGHNCRNEKENLGTAVTVRSLEIGFYIPDLS